MTAQAEKKPKNYTGVTLNTSNYKLGRDAMVTYRKVGLTCPSTCEYLNAGCYAQKYHSDMSAKHAPHDAERFDSEMTIKTASFLHKDKKPSMLRFHTSGDVMLYDKPQHDYIDMLNKWADIYTNRLKINVINYTHAWKEQDVQSIKKYTRASVHNIQDAKEAIRNGWHVAYGITDGKTAKEVKEELKAEGLNGVHCPFQTHKIQCQKCKLCVVKGSIDTVIILEKH